MNTVYEQGNRPQLSVKQITGVIIVIFAFIVLLNSFTIIDGGKRGIVFSRISGISNKVMDEGLNLKIPFVDSIIEMDVRSQKVELKLSSTSKDQQIVDVSVAFNYKVNAEMVNKIYQEIGMDYVFKFINPVLEDRIKSVMANFKAEELIQNRNEVSVKVLEDVREKLRDNYIIAEKINILNIKFSDSYNQAIEQKVVAEQQEQKAINDLERIKIEAEQMITQAKAEADANLLKAEAEAKSIKIQQTALRNSKEILNLRWIEKWNGTLPQVVSGKDSGYILNLNK